jgi:prepilin-type processing-associated H-X9-DG protein
MTLAQIRTASHFVLSGDCTGPRLYRLPFGNRWEYSTDDCDKDDAMMKSLSFPWDEMGFRMHRGGNNVLFDDGHVALFPRFDPASMTYDPIEMLDWGDVTKEPLSNPPAGGEGA